MGRKLSQIYTCWLQLFIISGCLSAFSTNSAIAQEAQWIKPTSSEQILVVDGDSLEIGKKRIRLMGIDAPEYDQSCKDEKGALYPCGKQSAQYLQNLINHKKIKCKIHKKDKYDRELCTCYADDKNLNAQMIKDGQAIVYLESDYHSEQETAQKEKKGIWRGIFIHPRLFRLLKSHSAPQN